MATGFDQAGVGFDDADYTFDGTFIGVSPGGGPYKIAFAVARNVGTAQAANTAAVTAANVGR